MLRRIFRRSNFHRLYLHLKNQFAIVGRFSRYIFLRRVAISRSSVENKFQPQLIASIW